MSSLIGRKLGQYEVIEILGKGGMASVYLGKQASIDRLVAIKVLPPHPALDEAFKERFQLEARTIGSLQNPNILPLYDYGVFEDVLYLVMAYAEGGTLEDIMDSGPMNVTDVEKYLRIIASALDYAHRKGVIHRDVKPANILIQDGHPLLADFGMVRITAGNSNLTGTAIVGTPSYMAPEQGQGLEVDQRVDVYALGAMVYEMLTGEQPFKGATPMQMILAHINEPVPDIRKLRPDLPEAFTEIMEMALSKNPDERYQTAGEFAEAFTLALHKNSDTLAQVKKAFPIAADADATSRMTVNLKRQEQSKLAESPTTVIVRDSVNPIVLMGGFGLIAIVIVIIAVLLINNSNNNTPIENTQVANLNPTTAPTSQAIPTATVPIVPSFGEVRFSTESSFGDRVEVRLRGVRSADNYAAWLINTESGEVLSLGRVVVDGFGEGTVTYSDADGRMLPAVYNNLLVTAETTIGESPSDTVLYSALLPLSVSDALTQIFVASENGLSGGSLLDGAMRETNTAIQHSGLAASATNVGGMRTHAEHTINILRGTQDDHDGSGSGSNPGRGVGIYFFMDEIDTLLESITNQADASLDLQSNAEFIRVCTQNARLWADEVVGLELTMIQSETVEAAADEAAQSTMLASQILEGFDLNEDGVIQPFEGECGLNQIPDFGLQFARMEIREGDVRSSESE